MIRCEQWAEPDDKSSGQYMLEGVDCSEPSGSAEEMLAIAEGLRARKAVSFRRIEIRPEIYGGFTVVCPRNAHGPSDVDSISDEEAGPLADQIIEALRDAGERCVYGMFDPISMGA